MYKIDDNLLQERMETLKYVLRALDQAQSALDTLVNTDGDKTLDDPLGWIEEAIEASERRLSDYRQDWRDNNMIRLVG